jgi:hypothetical protein
MSMADDGEDGTLDSVPAAAVASSVVANTLDDAGWSGADRPGVGLLWKRIPVTDAGAVAYTAADVGGRDRMMLMAEDVVDGTLGSVAAAEDRQPLDSSTATSAVASSVVVNTLGGADWSDSDMLVAAGHCSHAVVEWEVAERKMSVVAAADIMGADLLVGRLG